MLLLMLVLFVYTFCSWLDTFSASSRFTCKWLGSKYFFQSRVTASLLSMANGFIDKYMVSDLEIDPASKQVYRFMHWYCSTSVILFPLVFGHFRVLNVIELCSAAVLWLAIQTFKRLHCSLQAHCSFCPRQSSAGSLKLSRKAKSVLEGHFV